VPEISRFFGIVVSIQFRDHDPPHFHATYGEHEITVSISEGEIQGFFPKRALRLIEEWRTLHRNELLENWRLARERRPLKPVTPLEWAMLNVTSVRHLHDYVLHVRFNNGVEGEVDLALELEGEVFEPLRDPAMFAQAQVDPDVRTVAWPNGADLAPEFLLSLLRVKA
jgi:hypothetical protein